MGESCSKPPGARLGLQEKKGRMREEQEEVVVERRGECTG